MFLLVPAYPGCPGSKAVKRSLLLLLLFNRISVTSIDLLATEFFLSASFIQNLKLDLLHAKDTFVTQFFFLYEQLIAGNLMKLQSKPFCQIFFARSL